MVNDSKVFVPTVLDTEGSRDTHATVSTFLFALTCQPSPALLSLCLQPNFYILTALHVEPVLSLEGSVSGLNLAEASISVNQGWL
jgi:hypothetical protein